MELLNSLDQNLFNTDTLKSEPTRDGFGKALVELGHENQNMVALAADLADSTRAEEFGKEFPERFIQTGVAEQNMMGVAAGLALEGKVPFACSFACFNPGRNWEQVRLVAAYSDLNIKIIGSHSGLSNAPDGATHQSLEDIALTRVLPNITVVAPSDAVQAEQATKRIAAIEGPVYMRLSRHATPIFTTTASEFEIGKANILKKGKDITIVACGLMVYESLRLAKMLEEKGIDAEVIEMHTIKPLDSETLISSVKKTDRLVTIEEHQIAGGLGSASLEAVSTGNPVKTLRIGMEDSFGQSARDPKELYEYYGLTAERMIERVLEFLLK